MYVCNCNGIREREVRAAIAAGARRPAEVFKSKGCSPKCAKCVCDMRAMITESRETLRTRPNSRSRLTGSPWNALHRRRAPRTSSGDRHAG